MENDTFVDSSRKKKLRRKLGLKFGDKVMWRGQRAIFDFVNAHGNAIILMHPDDGMCGKGRKKIDHGHHDVGFDELTKGWKGADAK